MSPANDQSSGWKAQHWACLSPLGPEATYITVPVSIADIMWHRGQANRLLSADAAGQCLMSSQDQAYIPVSGSPGATRSCRSGLFCKI